MKFKIRNNTLNPEIWNNDNILKPEIGESLRKIASDFYKECEIKSQLEDVLFLGSLANYNYNSKSDIDLHLLVDTSDISMPELQKEKYLKSLSFRWNTDHNIKIKNHKVEVYIQDINEENKSTGVYSLGQDKWIKVPEIDNIVLNKPLIKSKYHQLSKQIDNAIKEENVDKLKVVLRNIMNFRQKGLDDKGEYSESNIAFKILRDKGDLKKLKDAINKNYDKLVSVKEISNIVKENIEDDEKLAKAERYFNIGHDDDQIKNNYCWIWDGSNVKVKKGGNHGINFSHQVADKTFKGWYDIEKNIISVVFPEYQKRYIGNREPTIDDIPQNVYQALQRKFGKNDTKIEVFEGYGMGDPSKDKKAVGRWTVKFDSDSKPLKEEDNTNTFQMYHGGQKWYNIEDLQPIKKGKYEHGVGIYLTTNYETARKYAKGNKVVTIVDINKNFTDITKINLNSDEVLLFLTNLPRLKNRNNLINDIKSYLLKRNTNVLPAEILNNLIVNNESGHGIAGVEITKFLVSKGVDAAIVHQSNEDWLVVFNPKIIKKFQYVNPNNINNTNYNLPKIN